MWSRRHISRIRCARNDAFKRENDEFRSQAKDNGITITTLQRSLKEFTVIGTPEELAVAKQRVAALPPTENPQMAEMQAQLDAMKKERDEEAKAREAAEARQLAGRRRSRLREIVNKAGVRSELVDTYVNDLERRGLSEDGGRLYIGPVGGSRAAEDLISNELSNSLKILVASAVPAPGSKEDVQPIMNLDPDEVTLSGDQKERQAALAKLGEQLYPNLVSRATGGQNVSRT